MRKGTENGMGRHKVISNKRKQKNKPDILTEVSQLFRLGLHMLVTIYMLLMIVVLPFYFTDGYARIGTDKFNFFYKSTCIVGIFFLFFWVFYIVTKVLLLHREGGVAGIKKEFIQGFRKLSVTDRFVLGYGVVVLLSYLFSDYKTGEAFGNAFVGVNRWYLGLRTQILLVAVYFAVSRFFKRNKWLPSFVIPVTLVVFALGYLNRFQVYPFEMKNTTIEFISTVGNMNWYCGYIVIVFFGGLYYLWTMSEKKIWINAVLGTWMTVGFATLVTQGSSSGLVTLVVMLLVLYLFSMKNAEKLLMFLACCMSLGFVCMVTYCIRSFFPERFNYPDGLTDLLTNSPVAFVLLAGASVVSLLLVFLQKKGKSPVKAFTIVGYGACILAVVALVVFVVLGVINTKHPGSLGKLSEVSALTFNKDWGSYRGATWVAGVWCFTEQDLIGKLLGVGPDCMAMYLDSASNPEITQMLEEYFKGKLLTNAHCEWLTVLVNNGLLGLVCYAGLFVSAIVRYLKSGKVDSMTGACGFAILAYTINNLFGFQQAFSAVTVFIVLGMGEAFVQEKVQKKT